jgi:glycerol kinase
LILAIDQGTTGTTCLVFDEAGRVAGRAYSEFEQFFPKPGWVEHDAAEIWDVTRKVGSDALDEAGIDGGDLSGIGITNQRETVVAWDRDSGEPLHRAIVWQDRRTAERCDELKEEGTEELFRERTGLVLDSYFSGTKIEWLIEHGDVDPGAAFGTIDSWLVHKLTGEFVTDYSNASRTLLFDIRKLAWDEELCEILSVRPGSLGEPVKSAEVYGETDAFGGSVPVAGIAGDQQAALYGQACHERGQGKNTYGTGSFVLQNAGSEAPDTVEGLLTTVAWGVKDRVDYALEASIFVTGAAVQWLRDGLGIIERADETEDLAAELDGNDGVYLVPAFAGLGSPHWDPYARGTIVGLTRGNGRAHFARAALESIAYQTVDAVRAVEEASGVEVDELKADGGASENAWLMRFQADMLGIPVVVPEISETTALGAGYLAGVATGLWSEEDARSMWSEAARYEPNMSEDERQTLLAEWHAALDRARSNERLRDG